MNLIALDYILLIAYSLDLSFKYITFIWDSLKYMAIYFAFMMEYTKVITCNVSTQISL